MRMVEARLGGRMEIRSPFGRFAQLGLALLVFAVPVSACGDTTPVQLTSPGVAHNAPKATSETVRTVVGPGTPVIGDTVPVGDGGGSVTVSATEAHVSAGRLFPAGKGKDYYAAQVKACSGPDEKGLTFKPGYFLLEMADKTVHDAGPGVKKPDLRGDEVPAGGCLDGWVTFVIPEAKTRSAPEPAAQPAFVVYDGSQRLRWTIPADKPKKAGR
jgi:hypothetical protein